MKKSVVFLFSGQGSQYYGMGRELFSSNSTFRNKMIKFDCIYREFTGESILDELYSSEKKISDSFQKLKYTHPAIFIFECAIADMLIEMGIQPDYVLGASLGEFVAAAVTGVMTFEDALECVIRQVKVFEDNCSEGGMLAVLNDIEMYKKDPVLHTNSELSSINFPSHFVVSGSTAGLAKIEQYLKINRCTHMRLPVEFAFHSGLIESAGYDFKEIYRFKNFNQPKPEYISCVTGERKTNFDYEYFWSIIRKPMQFVKAIQEVSSLGEHIYIDLGPSGTLANFTKYNLGRENISNIYPIVTPYGCLKNLDKLLSAFAS